MINPIISTPDFGLPQSQVGYYKVIQDSPEEFLSYLEDAMEKILNPESEKVILDSIPIPSGYDITRSHPFASMAKPTHYGCSMCGTDLVPSLSYCPCCNRKINW